jgi:hypothetical protein
VTVRKRPSLYRVRLRARRPTRPADHGRTPQARPGGVIHRPRVQHRANLCRDPTQNRRSASACSAPGHYTHHAQADLHQGRPMVVGEPLSAGRTSPVGTNPVQIAHDTTRHSTAFTSTNRHVGAPRRTSALVRHSSSTTAEERPGRAGRSTGRGVPSRRPPEDTSSDGSGKGGVLSPPGCGRFTPTLELVRPSPA